MAILWWTALKRSLSCKSQGSCDVIKRDDGSRVGSAREFNFNHKKSSSFWLQPSSSSMPRSGCSRSISNLQDVIHSARFQAPPPPAAARGVKCDSPMSVGSCDVLNAVTHDVLLATGLSGRDLGRVGADAGPGLAAWDIGAVQPFAHSPFLMRSATANGGARLSQRKSPLHLGAGVYGAGSPLPAWASCGEVVVRCNRCDGLFPNDDALESHHLVYHAVTEVADGETASKVVELIYSAGWPNPEAALDRVERVVKVHSMERRVDRFKEYTEEVKGRAARLPNSSKHPRCVADGNELLRFHGATVSCSLGAGGSHSVCTSSLCNVCRIISHGFSRNGAVGVLTTSTSKRALDCLQETGAGAGGGGEDGADDSGVRHALFVCRVIAGRIHRPLEKLRQGVDVAVQPGFDSVAGQVGEDSSIEKLYLLNPSALLPCFVVICKA